MYSFSELSPWVKEMKVPNSESNDGLKDLVEDCSAGDSGAGDYESRRC
jgi:hypothetical protein